MSLSDIKEKLINLQDKLKNDGIMIVGITGSYARGDFTDSSDVDLLYEIIFPEEFVEKNGMFGSFTKIEEIREYISQKLGKKVDLIAKNSLNEIGVKYILEDSVSV